MRPGSAASSLATLGELLLGAVPAGDDPAPARAGMTMLRMPVFCWSMVATCLLVLTSFPVLIVAMALLWIDRQEAACSRRPAGRSPTSTCSGSTGTRSST